MMLNLYREQRNQLYVHEHQLQGPLGQRTPSRLLLLLELLLRDSRCFDDLLMLLIGPAQNPESTRFLWGGGDSEKGGILQQHSSTAYSAHVLVSRGGGE